ncbi:lipoyl(octanoyl) transferase LipB [Nannocystis sp. SCPEA4]|uniref:lipoyl(octanoyl) transferase LipB n=1 Tax=Nannocystis sp. SCPEA4 TaxID=2996787 RepID=UPI002270EC05|nr:lipoyl(octanoyl) transferase LipB [Nannocystis sp. SCPEA4]
MASTPESLRAVWLGRMGFDEVLALQLAARERVVAGEPGVLFLVEHPPVLTLGRRGKMEDILWSAEQRAAAGVTVSEAPRGGEVTLHGPGQLVAYPVVMVGRRIREHIVRLAEVAIELLRELGVEGCEFRMEHPGVWRGSEKLASIGIHISRGVSVQGISINLDVDQGLFGALVSCGLRGVTVTSAAAVGGREVGVEAAGRRFAAVYAAQLGLPLVWEGAEGYGSDPR